MDKIQTMTTFHISSDIILKNQFNQKLKLMVKVLRYVLYSNKLKAFNLSIWFQNVDQIQRNLQRRIEEQGRQLKMMFDQQQKTRQTLLGDQNSDNMSPNGPSFSLDEVQLSSEEGSGCNNFQSKIS